MTVAWAQAKYPGDAARIALLIRDNEIGDIRIQDYGQGQYKVGAFLPGETSCSPGDTPKTWPERDEWCTACTAADAKFDEFVQAAYADGWKDYNRETGKAA